jgi:HPr kinase/phosphorylase
LATVVAGLSDPERPWKLRPASATPLQEILGRAFLLPSNIIGIGKRECWPCKDPKLGRHRGRPSTIATRIIDDRCGNSRRHGVNVDFVMPDGPATQTITSASDQRKSVPVVTVESFFNTHAEKLALRLEGPRVGFHRKIREPTINRPGLALCGFFSYFADKRVQVLGAAENTYLKSLSPSLRGKRFRALCEQKIPCLVISRGAHLDDPLMAVAADEEIAVFRTPMITMKFINAATIALEVDFSPTVTEFGSMVDILGVGVLIRGVSGIGKSESVLQLIERGYSLVADDVTRITSLEGRELMAAAPEMTRYHMEVRGIGIINVASVFGIGAIRVEKRLDMVVTLKDWNDMEEVDRTGLDREFYEILDIKVPHITIPVRPGRDLARLIEVAAMDQKLKSLGSNAALEFNTKLLNLMEKKNPDGIA